MKWFEDLERERITKEFVETVWDEFINWAIDNNEQDAVVEFAEKYEHMKEDQYKQFVTELREYVKKKSN